MSETDRSIQMQNGAQATGGDEASPAKPPGAADPLAGDVSWFVRSHFSVRRLIVAVWRPLPANLWIALHSPEQVKRSRRREWQAVLGVSFIAMLLLGVCANAGVIATPKGDVVATFRPWVGWRPGAVSDASPGLPGGDDVPAGHLSGQHVAWRWGYSVGLMALWTIGPSLAGWVCVRGIWIPLSLRQCRKRRGHCNNGLAEPDVRWQRDRRAVLAFARHLGSVYLFVYVMIAVGVAVLFALLWLAPDHPGVVGFRWALWCFLFGEAFFVPSVMWTRLNFGPHARLVFGRKRGIWLLLWLAAFVVVPIVGMVGEL